jgi:hypothetical protein
MKGMLSTHRITKKIDKSSRGVLVCPRDAIFSFLGGRSNCLSLSTGTKQNKTKQNKTKQNKTQNYSAK